MKQVYSDKKELRKEFITAVETEKLMKKSREDKIFLGIVFFFLSIFLIAVLYPLIYVVSCSFSSPSDLVAGRVFLLPVNPGLQGYKAVFKDKSIWAGYRNTIVYTALATLVGTVVTFIGSFVLSRREFPVKNALTGIFAFTMFFNGGTVPTYLLLKQMHMLNTIWAMILPGAFSVWLAIIGRTYIQSSIPEELFEATNLDGGSYLQYFFRIIVPLGKPILAVLALNFALANWNSYYSALLYLNDSSKYPLQIVLRNILLSNQMSIEDMGRAATDIMKKQYLAELLKYSLIVVSSLPLMIVYPFLQKYFIKGTMVGSIKG